MAFKVLIVDDCQITRQFVTAAFQQLPCFTVFESKSGFEALKILPRHRFDLIITDINMPDINGLELINFVKKSPNYKDTPLFIISTASSEVDRKRGLALGAAEYLVKPLDSKVLASLVRRYIKVD